MSCLLCNGITSTVLDLGETPLANSLRTTPDAKQPSFPLIFVRCTVCSHLQLDHPLPREAIFCDYPYVSDNSNVTRLHFRETARRLIERFRPRECLDIGSNDGLFLHCLQERSDSMRLMGVDPSENATAIALARKVPADCAFFDEKWAQAHGESYGAYDLVTCLNAFAHNPDLVTILRGIRHLLRDTGVFVFEVAYAMPMLEQALFDLIYHEHIHHWTLTAAIPFLLEHGFEVFHADEVPVHGGSLRVYVRRRKGPKGKIVRTPSCHRLLDLETERLQALVDAFPGKVAQEREVARAVLEHARMAGEGAIGLLGYPAKACTMLSYWGCASDIQHVFDDNPRKQGRYTHFGHWILSTDEVRARAPARLLVSSWNYADELAARFPQYRGRLLVPHPMRAA